MKKFREQVVTIQLSREAQDVREKEDLTRFWEEARRKNRKDMTECESAGTLLSKSTGIERENTLARNT